MDADVLELRPQPGAQETLLGHWADIVIGGGQAGGGKTFGLLLEALRHVEVSGFNAVLFRRTYAQLQAAGGPWPESLLLYPLTNGRPGKMRWRWSTGAQVQFSHLQHEKDRLSWKGAQIALLLFDQLEDFHASQFWYLLSRNRSTCGVRPYVRATCNPVPPDDPTGGWLYDLLSWWIGEDGYPIPDRAGVARWFVRDGETLVWADDAATLSHRYPSKPAPRSLAFVPMRLEDNAILQAKDPDYVATLEALPYVERMRLRYGNWHVRAVAGTLCQRHWFGILAAMPAPASGVVLRTRYWDCAATAGAGDWTVGAKVAKLPSGRWVVEDIQRGRWSPADVERAILATAQQDGRGVRVREEQEGGSSGKAVTAARARALAGWDYRGVPVTGEKQVRWRGLLAQAEAGNVDLVRAPWNDGFLAEMEQLPEGVYDDQADATAGAFNDLAASAGVIHRVRLAGFGT